MPAALVVHVLVCEFKKLQKLPFAALQKLGVYGFYAVSGAKVRVFILGQFVT